MKQYETNLTFNSFPGTSRTSESKAKRLAVPPVTLSRQQRRRLLCRVQTAEFVLLCFRFTEKGNLEVLLFTIQSKMRANNQKVYTPREGKLISDINKVPGRPASSSVSELKNGAFKCLFYINLP